jgi:hypothetical protein
LLKVAFRLCCPVKACVVRAGAGGVHFLLLRYDTLLFTYHGKSLRA